MKLVMDAHDAIDLFARSLLRGEKKATNQSHQKGRRGPVVQGKRRSSANVVDQVKHEFWPTMSNGYRSNGRLVLDRNDIVPGEQTTEAA